MLIPNGHSICRSDDIQFHFFRRTLVSYAPAKRERTFAITLLAILAGIAGILSLLDAMRYMGWLPFKLGDTGMQFVVPQAQWFAAIMAAIVGVIWLVVAWWLWTLNPSGWLFVVVIAVINLIFLFLAILGKTSFSDVLLQILVNAAALILALLPSTKQAFLPPLPSPEQVKAAQAKAQASVAATKADVAAKASAATAGAATAAASTVAAPIAKEDLTKIEGVGPKTAEALKAAGITNYAQLSAMTPDQIRAILSKAGLSGDPTTWPKQAQMAAAGQWDALKAYQDTLEGGKSV
jgi:predicted flap endonuclease-1-like 5' DNA nuclease